MQVLRWSGGEASVARVWMREAGFSPLAPYPGAARPWRSRCMVCGVVSSPRYASVMAGHGCRACGTERTRQARRVPEKVACAAMKRAGLSPLGPYPGANSPWISECTTCHRQVSPTYSDVTRGVGCKHCSWSEAGRRRRLDTREAVRVMLGASLEPLVPYGGSNKPWPCRCLVCGVQVRPRHANIAAGWGGCPTCALRSRVAKRRRSEADAVAIMRAAGVEPLESYESEMTPWRSQCGACGREVAPRLNNVKRGCDACAYCSKNKADPKEAAVVMSRAGLKPLIPYPGRHAPWPAQCKRCGQVVTPRYGDSAP
jgi:hypothetical protein